MVREYFNGAAAVLRPLAVADLRPGNPDANIACERKQARYAEMDPSTMPPIIVDEGKVVDGNHRLRVAVARGEATIMAYDVVAEEDLEEELMQSRGMQRRVDRP